MFFLISGKNIRIKIIVPWNNPTNKTEKKKSRKIQKKTEIQNNLLNTFPKTTQNTRKKQNTTKVRVRQEKRRKVVRHLITRFRISCCRTCGR